VTMAAKHGTRSRYLEGCRCDDCKAAQRLYQQRYRERRANGTTQLRPTPVVQLPERELQPSEPGPVESGVTAEISGLAAEARPGLAQAAIALARILDSPRAVNQQPAAAKVLGTLLERLHSASAHRHRGRLAVVRAMSTGDDPPEGLSLPSARPRERPT
jgi:hypothetical protein